MIVFESGIRMVALKKYFLLHKIFLKVGTFLTPYSWREIIDLAVVPKIVSCQKYN